MRWCGAGLLVIAALMCVPVLRAQSLWERRDPYSSQLFVDNRARWVGDVLTIAVNETTEVEGFDKKELDKATSTTAGVTGLANYSLGTVLLRTLTANASGSATSERKFDGKANTSIDRRLVDRMTVVVVAVLPNGNLVIEGHRTRDISHEARTLMVKGIVRPLDIGPNNTVQSHYIAEFCVFYEGRGPESSYTEHGWLGKVMNKLWPF